MAQTSMSGSGEVVVVVVGEAEARTAMPATSAWNAVGVIDMLAIGVMRFFCLGCIVDDVELPERSDHE